MTRFDATEHNLSVSLFPYIWNIVLLLNTFWHEWSPIITLCNKLLYKIGFDLYTVYMTRFDVTEHNLTFTHVLYIWTIFTAEHVLTLLVTPCNELLYTINFDMYTVSKTFFDAT
jgi:hypothetical protein